MPGSGAADPSRSGAITEPGVGAAGGTMDYRLHVLLSGWPAGLKPVAFGQSIQKLSTNALAGSIDPPCGPGAAGLHGCRLVESHPGNRFENRGGTTRQRQPAGAAQSHPTGPGACKREDVTRGHGDPVADSDRIPRWFAKAQPAGWWRPAASGCRVQLSGASAAAAAGCMPAVSGNQGIGMPALYSRYDNKSVSSAGR